MAVNIQLLTLCYLIFSPTIFAFKLQNPFVKDSEDGVDRQGVLGFDQYYQETSVDRSFEIPDNLLPVAAVGFLAGLLGPLFTVSTTTDTTTTTTTAATTG